MLRASLVACLAASVSLGLGTGCGPKVPTHNGYGTKKPWSKPKTIELDEQHLGSSKGELDYADKKRAKWLALAIGDGNLTVDLEFTPTDDAEDATVAMEILDANFKVISEDEDAPLVAPEPEEKSDEDEEDGDDEEDEEDEEEEEEEEEDDSGGDTQKQRILPNLAAGTYYVHLFLTKRTDSAEYKVAVKYEPVVKEVESDFPKEVAWVPALPIVPLDDDAPAPVVPKDKDKDKDKKPKKPKDKDKDKPDEPDDEPVSTGSVTANIIDVKVSGTGAEIVIGAGTDQGLSQGRKGSISGVKKGGSFTITSCTARTCKASVSASVDEVNRSKKSVTVK